MEKESFSPDISIIFGNNGWGGYDTLHRSNEMKKCHLITASILILIAAFASCTADNNAQGDRPLKKQGSDPHFMPFKSTSEYIRVLEDKKRDAWQKPEAVIEALKLKRNEKVADIGAGSGYFSFRIAKAVPGGKVYAIDINPDMLAYIRNKAKKERVANITTIRSSTSDPEIPRNVSMVFMCDVLHMVSDRTSDRASWLDKLGDEVKRGTKLVIIDYKMGKLPVGPPERIKISADKIISMAENAGFKLLRKDAGMLPYQIYFLFEKS
jgi:predicted methyltransferase